MDITSFTEDKRFAPLTDGARLSHAYLISGPAGSGADALADTLAAAAVCSGAGMRPCGRCRHCEKSFRGVHPDIVSVRRLDDKREILVDQVRFIPADAAVLPNEAERKVYIIRDAGKMNASAQNALLKVLEEPPRHAVLILTAENPSELLPTVRSRCVEWILSPGEERLDEKAEERARALLDAAAAGPLETARFSFTLDRLSRQEFAEMLEAGRTLCARELRRAMTGGGGAMTPARLQNAVRAMEKAAELLDRSVSTGHAAGCLCAALNAPEG